MKAETRDKMVARVKATFAEYPTYESLPVMGVDEFPRTTTERHEVPAPRDQHSYICALYASSIHGRVFARGADGDLYWGED